MTDTVSRLDDEKSKALTPARPGVRRPDITAAGDMSRRAWFGAGAIVVFGLLFTLLLTTYRITQGNDARDQRFNQVAADAQSRLEAQFATYGEMLIGFRGLYAVGADTFDDFDDYVAATEATTRLPGTQLVGYAREIPTSAVSAFELSVRGDGYPSFSVHPANDGATALPIIYVSPLEENTGAFGLDLDATTNGRATIDRAAKTAQPMAGSPLVVVGGEARAFNLFVAIYDGAAVPGEDQRMADFQGVAVATIVVDEALDGLLGADPAVDFEIYDLGVQGAPEIFEPTESNALFTSTGDLTLLTGTGGPSQTRDVVVGGRRWRLLMTPGPGFDAEGAGIPILAILGSLAVTGLVAALMLMAARTRRRADRLSNEMKAYLHQREQELEEANDNFQRSNKELERYASIAAHDLQEPLRSLLAYSSVLERRFGDTLDEEVLDYVSRMSRAAERMRSLVVDLLSYAKADSSVQRQEQVDLNEAVRIAIDDLSAHIHESGATIRVGELPIVPGNRRELIGVFSNLVSNGLKYRGEDPPELLVVAQRNNDLWTIGVKDNGIGIAPAYHDRVFELFRRLEKRDSDAGTGLGLAICARTIQQHGGRIWVESDEGQGATFWFTLPAEPRPERG